MGAAAGLGGLVSGIAGASSQKKAERHLRTRLEGERDAGLGYLEEAGEEYRGNPLLNQLAQIYAQELGGMPSQETRSGLFDQAAGGVNALFDNTQGFGISNPQVQEQIYNSAMESLLPALASAKKGSESRQAARGFGRSGMAEDASRQMDFQAGQAGAGLKRDIGIQGAMQALQDQMTKIGAASGLYGLGEQAAGATRGQAGQFGLQQAMPLMELAQALSQMRMQHAGLLAGQGPDQNPWDRASQSFFQYQQGLGQGGAGSSDWYSMINPRREN